MLFYIKFFVETFYSINILVTKKNINQYNTPRLCRVETEMI